MKKFLLSCFVALGIGANSQITLPYTETFGSIAVAGDLPTVTGGAWSRTSTATIQPTYIANQTTYNRSGNGDTKFIAFRWDSGTRSYFVGPFTLNAGVSYSASTLYKADGSTGFGPLKLKFGTDATVATHTNTIATVNANIINASYATIGGAFTVPTTGNYYLSIECTANGNPWYLSLDDFSLKLTPSCVSPTAIVGSGITSSSATVSWTAPATAPVNGYDLYYSTSSTAPTSTTTPTSTGITGVTTSLSGLSPNTTYNVWVRSACAGSDKSDWSSILTFKTFCAASGIPYSQNFESVTVPALPSCTTVQNAGTGNNWATFNLPASTFELSAGNVLRYTYSSAAPANTWFYTQGLALTGGTTYELKFRSGSSNADYTEKLKVAYGTSPNNTAMTNLVVDYPEVEHATSSVKTFYITPTATGTYYFGFNAYSATDQAYLYLDDISVGLPPTTLPGCTTITAPVSGATGVSPTPTTISWAASNTASAYKVYVGTTSGNYDIANGTSTTSLSYISNLLPYTTYYAKVVPTNIVGDATGCSEISFTTGVYCAGSGTVDGNTGLAITKVAISTLSNTSARSAYTDFTGNVTPTELRLSTAYTISITNGSTTGFYTNDVAYVWIDYNQDGTFSDTTERTAVTVNAITNSASISIPATATLGTTRMRVKYSNSDGNNSNTACGIATYGEVEDYSVKITSTLAVSDVNKSEISVYPNPFTDVLKISDVKGVKSVSVNDISGREVKSLAPSAELNLSNLKAGLYIVNLQMEDGSVKSFKTIKK